MVPDAEPGFPPWLRVCEGDAPVLAGVQGRGHQQAEGTSDRTGDGKPKSGPVYFQELFKSGRGYVVKPFTLQAVRSC